MTDPHRQSHVEHFAAGVKAGRHDRSQFFMWTNPDDGQKHDITDEVMAAAGPESDAETEARVLQHEKDVPWRLASELEELCFRELAWADQYVGGHRFVVSPPDDDDPGDELVLERDDGKRFLVEVQISVRPE